MINNLFLFFYRYAIISLVASMAELVDAADSKSASSDRVPVQVRMEAPFNNLIHNYCGFYYSILQSISSILFFFKNSFVLLNGLLPKNPFLAENGEG